MIYRQPTLDGSGPAPARPAVEPPSTHQLAAMIWLAVVPTLTVLNLALGDWLRTMTPLVRTVVLATAAVPIVVYVVMPRLQRLRHRVITRAARRAPTTSKEQR